MMRGSDITNPSKRTNPGFPVQFEILKKFPGRMAEAAMRPDLYGKVRPTKPWLDYLPRVIFVSDMGDALSEGIDFDYLKHEIIDVVFSARGRQHIWLWLTKMPKRMAEFAEWLKNEHHLDWPDHLIAMTSVTSMKTVVRAEQLLKVPARFRGLSVEPLWEEVTLPLTGIDWCIVGGQSGSGAKLFDVAWIRSLQDQCRKSGTALYVKQLGARPVSATESIELKDEHGGDWNQWPMEYRIRELPTGFWKLKEPYNDLSSTPQTGRDVKPHQVKPAKTKIVSKSTVHRKTAVSTSKPETITAPDAVVTNSQSKSPNNIPQPSAPVPPDQSQSALVDVQAAPVPAFHEAENQIAHAAAVGTAGEVQARDEHGDARPISFHPVDATESSSDIPIKSPTGTNRVVEQTQTIQGVRKPETPVKIKSCAQGRYEPRIIRQRFTFRISQNEDGWGIWDKDIGKWHIEPVPGVTPADLADLLPQVQALKHSLVKNNELI